MARGAGEPSAKRAKVDEKEEEDPLVRRKEEVVRLLERARAKGKGNARAKKELSTLCADFEAKNEKLLGRLPPELWEKILDENVQQNDLLALAMACRFFRDTTKGLGKKMETYLKAHRLLKLRKSGKMASHTLGWFQWVCDTFEFLPGCEWDDRERVEGAVYEGDLVNYAAFQGSVEILRWLVEEKGCELNKDTGMWAGHGGSVEVFEYIRGKGYGFDVMACYMAALGGHLEALKWLRGQDPPCRWDEHTCEFAAQGGSLEALKWLRDQDPPCPWDKDTCVQAAYRGQLEMLKWLRSQDPPCPWSRSGCRRDASFYRHQHIVDWIDQQEDESDEEFSDSDSERSYDSYGEEYF
ncbi:ANK_REP_REGION domain-containing protein [Chloropicon roscoffensis]|uniref:ANK_REP_REGION domain-containing protein n=1 Tax=Chloropicon roscoffensis TaxID=1461544 RepID=A0AAX4PL32_9CHLO